MADGNRKFRLGCFIRRKHITLQVFSIFCVIILVFNFVMFKWTYSPLNGYFRSIFYSKIKDPNEIVLGDFTNKDFWNKLKVQRNNQSVNADFVRAMSAILETESDMMRFLEWASWYKATQSQQTRSRGPRSDRSQKPESLRELVKDFAGVSNEMSCPEEPPDLIGALAGDHRELSMDKLDAFFGPNKPQDHYSAVEIGGRYRPHECEAIQKLAIIIPYRNRYPHLLILLNNLIPVLRRQQSDFQIFVIDQNVPTTFNRGMLQNVGYLEALKHGDFDCFAFHDVDMLPLNDKCLYRCSDNPIHLTAGISKWKYALPYQSYFGGITVFSKDQYRKINGNSNLYFGWGGEDDDLRKRAVAKYKKIIRYPAEIGRFHMIKHKRDAGNKANPDRSLLLNTSTRRQAVEGLSTSVYNVTSVTKKTLVTWIQVSINMSEVLKTTPKVSAAAIKHLLQQANAFEETAR